MAATKTFAASENLGLSIVENNGDGTGAIHVIQDSGSVPTGGATANNQTTQITAEQAMQATLGATNGAAVVTDANGTIQQYLRGIVKFFADALGAGTAAAAHRVTLASNDPAVALLGGTGSLKDNHAAWTTIVGVSGAPVISADLTTPAAVTDAPAAKLVITDIIVSADTAMSVLFEEETSGDDKLKVFIPANGTVQITPRGKLKLAVTAKKLMATASVAGNISILVLGYSEA